MLTRAQIKASLDEWSAWYARASLGLSKRDFSIEVPKKMASALVGVRRCGKTFLSVDLGLRSSLNVLYFNFEDPIFLSDNSVDNIDTIISVFTEFSGKEPQLLIFDEIQNISGWERWVRRCVDTNRWPLVITGSSAALLSSEISTSITGRCLERQIWPLSFPEYLRFSDTCCKSALEFVAAVRSYLTWGGFPAVILESNENERRLILNQYLGDIVLKDVMSRHEIRVKRHLDQIILFAMTNPASLFSYGSLKRAFGMNQETAQDYVAHLQDAFLIFEVSRFHPNLKVQSRDPKKLYVIDTGIRNAHARSTSDDLGKLAENAVYIELRRRRHEIFYFKGKGEVDFLITERGKPKLAIQVCYSNMDDPLTMQREVGSLLECLEDVNLKEGTILTLNREESLREKGRLINFLPLYKFLQSQQLD